MELHLDSTEPRVFLCPGLTTFTCQVLSQADTLVSRFCGTKNRTPRIYRSLDAIVKWLL